MLDVDTRCPESGHRSQRQTLKKERRNKAMDASILRAMIQANSRLKFGAPEKQAEVEKKFTMPVYYSHEPLHQEKSAAYKAAMWLIG